ncbi:MAG: ABC transporter permease [Planctomycetaceae bacterium]
MGRDNDRAIDGVTHDHHHFCRYDFLWLGVEFLIDFVVRAREQEIATLHVLGYTTREIARMFLQESLVLNIAGLLCGLPLGYALGWLMCESMGDGPLSDSICDQWELDPDYHRCRDRIHTIGPSPFKKID